MGTITLSRSGILALDEHGESVALSQIRRGLWRIVRRDSWQYDERVISALHTVRARPDVKLVDPVGLLGGSRYGFDINRDTKPVSTGSLTSRKRASRDLKQS
jgi:hypothetical protein